MMKNSCTFWMLGIYKYTPCAVRDDGELTDWLTTVVGVLQDCALSPLLFNIRLQVVTALALADLRALAAKISEIQISNPHFADDISLISESVPQL